MSEDKGLEMTKDITSLAELRNWEQRHDRGIPPRMILTPLPNESARDRLLSEIERAARSAERTDADAMRWSILDPHWAEKHRQWAEDWRIREAIYRDALAKLDADEARALVASQSALAGANSEV